MPIQPHPTPAADGPPPRFVPPGKFTYRDEPFSPMERLAARLCRATWTSSGVGFVPDTDRCPSKASTSAFEDDPAFYSEWMRCARFVVQLTEAGPDALNEFSTLVSLIRQMCNRSLDSEQAWLDAADECLARIDGGA